MSVLNSHQLFGCDVVTKTFKVEYSSASQSFILSKGEKILDRYKVDSLNNNTACRRLDFYPQHNLIVAELDLGSIGTSSIVDEISLLVIQVKKDKFEFHLEHSLLVQETIGREKNVIEKWSYKTEKKKDHLLLTIYDDNGKASLIKKFK